jgi:hypothetical protein
MIAVWVRKFVDTRVTIVEAGWTINSGKDRPKKLKIKVGMRSEDLGFFVVNNVSVS